jgi:hypothetical protein
MKNQTILYFGLKMKIKQKINRIYKNQKPVAADINLKYRCPNQNCGADHWRTSSEISVKNFKIVCYCGCIIKPKQIKSLNLKFVEEDQPKIEIKEEKSVIPKEILDKCLGVMINYGFTKEESEGLIKSAYIKNPTDNCVILIKTTLENIGVNYVESHEANEV